MSVKLITVRYIQAQQLNIATVSEQEAWASLIHCPNDVLPATFSSYNLVEIVTVGWETGARCRVKRMRPEKVLPYLNKLLFGGWISDMEYNKAWGASSRLLQKVDPMFGFGVVS